MANKKKPKATTAPAPDLEKYRKPFRPVRIKSALADVAEKAASDLVQDFTQWVNDAVRMRLEREGKWPPKTEGEQKTAT